MIGLNEQTPANDAAPAPAPSESRVTGAEPAGNGASATPRPSQAAIPPEAAAGPEDAPGSDRAEEMVDNLAHRVGYYAAVGTRKLFSFASRTREALQDFWAEVQDYRHGKKP